MGKLSCKNSNFSVAFFMIALNFDRLIYMSEEEKEIARLEYLIEI